MPFSAGPLEDIPERFRRKAGEAEYKQSRADLQFVTCGE
jgi:hypothetical protein